jgi:hypothetical protein
MADILDLYALPLSFPLPYDPQKPVLCIDEAPYQLQADVHPTISPAPGKPIHYEYEYEHKGVVNFFLMVEPRGGKRTLTLTDHRTKIDFAQYLELVADPFYPHICLIRLVTENLNTHTHTPAVLYEAFPPDPEKAQRFCQRFEWH